jgi:hypothetical protein
MVWLPFFIYGPQGERKKMFLPILPSPEETFELFHSVASCSLVGIYQLTVVYELHVIG